MKAALFDFNGTMFFDDEFQERAWRGYLEELLGRPVSHEEFAEHLLGTGVTFALSHFLGREVDGAEAIALEEEKEVVYRRLCLESGRFELAPGLVDYLDRLKAEGVPMNIATGSAERNVRFFFEHLGLDRWFDLERVALNDGTFPGKPAPDLFLRGAERIGVAAGGCTVFEDSPAGIASARAAGAERVVGVASSVAPEELLTAGADVAVADYREL